MDDRERAKMIGCLRRDATSNRNLALDWTRLHLPFAGLLSRDLNCLADTEEMVAKEMERADMDMKETAK